jgi:lipopolysaccharide assembly outer membrane protein LptD (OstA)
MLNNVIGNFYNDNNEVSMSFESSKGTYNENKEQIILYDDTFIVLKDLTTLRANKLEWSGTDKPVIAKGNVRITRNKDFLATAEEVEISPNYDRFKIIGNTVSKVYKENK